MVKVEFVCSGNTFRSRMAEAYLKSKNVSGVIVSSSGTKAKLDLNGPISWWGQRIIKNEGLIKFESRDWRQVTEEILEKADMVVFMERINYEYCRDEMGYTREPVIWDIPDVGLAKHDYVHEADINMQAEKVFQMIKTKVGDLVRDLNK